MDKRISTKFNYRAQGSLAMMIIVTIVITSISVAVGRISYNQYLSLANSLEEAESFLLADSAMEVVLLELYRDAEYTDTEIIFPEGTIDVSISDTGGTGKAIQTTSTENNIRRRINLSAETTLVASESGHYLTGFSSFSGENVQIDGTDAELVGDLHTNDGILIQNGATLRGDAYGRSGTTQIYNNANILDNPNTTSDTEGNVYSINNANIYNNVYIEGSVTTRSSVNTNASVVIDGGIVIDSGLTIDNLAIPTLDFSEMEAAAEANGTKFQWWWEMSNYIELNDRVSDGMGGELYDIDGIYYLDSGDTLNLNGSIPYDVEGAFVSQDGNVQVSPNADYNHVHYNYYPILGAGSSVYVRNIAASATVDLNGVMYGVRDVELDHANYNQSARTHGIILNGAAWSGDATRIRNKVLLDVDGDVINNVRAFDLSSPVSNWYDPAWGFRKPITINSSMVSGCCGYHADFTLLVKINADADLVAEAQADGDDILFTAGDGLTKYDHEIQEYNSSTGELTAWVRVPAVYPTSDGTLYMYYGNPAAGNQENVSGVWQDYAIVQHFEEDATYPFPGNLFQDSSPYNNDSSSVNLVSAQATGKIGDAIDFDGVNDLVEFADANSLTPNNDFTIELWINPDQTAPAKGHSYTYLTKRHSSSPWNSYAFKETDSGGSMIFQRINSGGSYSTMYSGSYGSAGNWYRFAITREGNEIRMYRNSNDAGSASQSGDMYQSNDVLRLGGEYYGGNMYDGKMDEMRIALVSRSRDYIFTNYNNENNPTAFVTVGGEQDEATFNVGGEPGGGTGVTTSLVGLNDWSVE